MPGESLIQAFGTHCIACGDERQPDDVYCGCGVFRPMGGWSTRAPKPETVESLLSRRLGKRYVFEHVVHKWGGHIEYRAQSATGTPVKFLFYTAAMESGFSRAFHNSGRAAKRIDDPRVATLLDFGTMAESAYYAAIKHVDGPSLDELLDRGPLKTDRALKLFLELAHALHALHQAGLSLGLLTPDDIVLTHDAGGDETVSIPPADWVIGPLVGRAPRRFAAPEMAKENANPKCDQYTLGFMMIEALTGHGRVEEHAAAEDVPRRVERMVRRLVDNDPDARFDSLEPVIKILTEALKLGMDQPEPTPPPVPGRLSTVKFEGIPESDSSSTPMPTVRYGATPMMAPSAKPASTPAPAAHVADDATPRAVIVPPPQRSLLNQFVVVSALTLAILAMIVAVVALGPLGNSPVQQAPVTVAATPVGPSPRPAIVEPIAEPAPVATDDGVADAENAENAEEAVGPTALTVAPSPRPIRPRPAPAPVVVAPVPEPKPEPEPEPAPAPAPTVAQPQPQPVVDEPGPLAFDVQTFVGVWRGDSRGEPIAFDLDMTQDGKVTGTARLTQGARISGDPLSGEWSRDGVGIQIDVETLTDKPVRYLGVLSGDLGKGVVIEKGKTKGDWEVRY